jgi:hypothetical protein
MLHDVWLKRLEDRRFCSIHSADDIYQGGFLASQGILPKKTTDENPTSQMGIGPMGRMIVYDILPLTVQTANIAALQAQTANIALVLAAGVGATAGVAPDGSQAAVIAFDVPRAVSLTSVSNLSAGNFTITGFDTYGRKQTQKLAGPNNNTVNTKKAFASVLSVVPDTTNAGTVSIGSSDIYGIPWMFTDLGYIQDVGWAGNLARDAGTATAADATTPATNATGDPRGTYLPSSASNGARRLVFVLALTAGQVGYNASAPNILGVTPA